MYIVAAYHIFLSKTYYFKQSEFQVLWNISHLFQAKFIKTKNVDLIFVGAIVVMIIW